MCFITYIGTAVENKQKCSYLIYAKKAKKLANKNWDMKYVVTDILNVINVYAVNTCYECICMLIHC